MEQEPRHEDSPSGPTFASTPPPPPFAGPYGGYYYPSYGPPPPPPRKPTSIWRIFAVLLLLCVIAFAVMTFLGVGVGRLSGTSLASLGHERLGLVRIEGMISQSEDKQFWIESLHELARSPKIKGIVVRIDSPGGTVGASQELHETILKIRNDDKKPVYVSMGDLAASGGYYTAAAAERVFANKGTLTGSIGVIFSKPQLSELTQKIGIQTEVIKSGRFKDAGDLMRPMTPEERELFDALIMNTYDQFVADVMATRKAPLTKALAGFPTDQWASYKFTKPDGTPTPEAFLRQIADGRIYTGQQALQLGLVDEIGSLQDTLEALGTKVKLGKRAEITEMTRRKGLSDLFKTKVGDLLPSSRSPLQYMMRWP